MGKHLEVVSCTPNPMDREGVYFLLHFSLIFSLKLVQTIIYSICKARYVHGIRRWGYSRAFKSMLLRQSFLELRIGGFDSIPVVNLMIVNWECIYVESNR